MHNDTQPDATSENSMFPTSKTKADAGAASGDWAAEQPDPQPPAAPTADGSAPPTEATPVNDVLQRVLRGAHDTLDSLAGHAVPTAQRLDAHIDGARAALQQQTGEIGQMRDEWLDLARQTVREHPLATLAAALALGVLIARAAPR